MTADSQSPATQSSSNHATPAATDQPLGDSNRSGQAIGAGAQNAFWGAILAGGFYASVYLLDWAPLQRYFLGHPVAIAATVLFWFAIAVLLTKWMGVSDQSQRLRTVRDSDLIPSDAQSSPAERWLRDNDAGHVARSWLAELAALPQTARESLLVGRLEELLVRQSQRGSTKHLADDLRELSARDADAAHDSLGLVRIIVWAIPMLGFLGTVIGITQTLGGLDFSNGTAAVDSLKSGLYIAFDTTALGLVLSVLAIFLQFPVERREQQLMADIDTRVGHLLSTNLPGDEASENHTALVAELCKGVQAAVAESLENQARLWRDTIDEAQNQWQSVHDQNTNLLAEAFELTLVPALQQHANSINRSSEDLTKQILDHSQQFDSTLRESCAELRNSQSETADQLVANFQNYVAPALRAHGEAIDRSTDSAAHRVDEGWTQWQSLLEEHAQSIDAQYSVIVQLTTQLVDAIGHTDTIQSLQASLDANLARLQEANLAIDHSVRNAASPGITDAMRVLAQAVEVLSNRMNQLPGGADDESPSRQSNRDNTKRHAA